MSDASAKPVIFISYSHKDRAWLDYVISHFRPAVRNEVLSIWYDKSLKGGDEINEEIAEQLNACALCILLVSRNSLDSEYIMNVEMDLIQKRGVRIYPIVVTRTTTWVVKWLDKKLLRPQDGEPLKSFKVADRDDEMVKIVEEIIGLTNQTAKQTLDWSPLPELSESA